MVFMQKKPGFHRTLTQSKIGFTSVETYLPLKVQWTTLNRIVDIYSKKNLLQLTQMINNHHSTEHLPRIWGKLLTIIGKETRFKKSIAFQRMFSYFLIGELKKD